MTRYLTALSSCLQKFFRGTITKKYRWPDGQIFFSVDFTDGSGDRRFRVPDHVRIRLLALRLI